MTRSQQLYRATVVFDGSKYEPTVKKMVESFVGKDFKKFDSLYKTLPTDIELLDTILEKVKGKRVFSTLKKTVSESIEDRTEALIGLSSLLTHVAIECKTNREFRALLPDIHEKVGALIGQV